MVTCQMTLERQATKCPDESELRSDVIYDATETDVCHELETTLGFTLHLG